MMRYAFFPGCVAKGTCPELYQSTYKVAEKLGMELDELKEATCCGAGVMQAKNPELTDTYNARTFALAEEKGLDTVVTICSTCQGYMDPANKTLKEDGDYLSKINSHLADGHHQYKGGVQVKHLMWILSEGQELENLKSKVQKSLNGLKVAPFYGCQILRPAYALGYDDPEKPSSMERIITALGGQPVDYRCKTRCCGFPIILENEKASLRMTGRSLLDAKENGAQCVVTPCPLCHLNLDIYQKKAEKEVGSRLDMPILHLSQLVGLSLGISAKELQLSKHFVSSSRVAGALGA
jgi:succinate dehydrogenase / fumarate reductase cytochrome b subunit